ncbi:hypothetical protein POW14_23430, partial [Klebsiella pneumoniae]
EWVHVQLHQQKGMISLSPPTICNSALKTSIKTITYLSDIGCLEIQGASLVILTLHLRTAFVS